jgi:UMF1 family MFS transporter
MPLTLRALGLDRRELRAWALYDWANSAFATTIMGSVLPVYFASVAASGLAPHLRTVYWGYTTTVGLVVIAVISPFLGAAADFLGAKKRFLAGFAAMGVLATACLYLVRQGDWLLAAALYVVGNIGFAAGNVFYESLLPHVARPDEIDRVSTGGYAMGYVGGALLLAANLAWIQFPESFGMADSAQASRVSFLSVALWWGIFTIPIMRGVSEPARRLASGEEAGLGALRVGFARVIATFKELRRHREVFVFLLAFWFYNDGINTIIKMSSIYGTELGLGAGHLIGAFLMVQVVGIPATFLYGSLAERIGAKRGIYLALLVYAGISAFGFFMSEPWHFWVLASGVALVQGGSQALSRSLFATLVPRGKSSQFFGFYSVSGKFGNVMGPLVFAVISQTFGGSRFAILSLVLFFAIGAFLLSRVDVEKGIRAAQAEDAELQPA